MISEIQKLFHKTRRKLKTQFHIKGGVMGGIRFETIVLSPDQVRQNVRPDDFPESGRVQGEADVIGESVWRSFRFQARIPSLGSFPVRVGEWFDGDSLRRTVQISLQPTDLLFARARRDCDRERPKDLPSIINYRPVYDLWSSQEVPLPARTMVTGVFYGDYNGDGKPDILVTLSNGGALVFQQVGEELPETKCQSVLRRLPRL